MTNETLENATMVEVEGQLAIKAVHQDYQPHAEGHMAFHLNEVDILSCEVVKKTDAGKLDFKLFHMKDTTNGINDLIEATDYVGGENEDVISTFCQFVREYDTLGLSDVANAIVFIENFEMTVDNPPTNLGRRALDLFMVNLEFLSTDFIVVNSTITDLANMTTEEKKFAQLYRGFGFRPFKGDADTYVFIQSNLLSLHVEDEL